MSASLPKPLTFPVELHRALYEASTLLLEPVAKEVIVARLVEVAKRFIPADAYAVWRVPESGVAWKMWFAEGLPADYPNLVATGDRRPEDMHDPFIYLDAQQVPVSRQQKQRYARDGVQSLISFPLRTQGGVFGALTLYFRRSHIPAERELELLSGLANIAATALKNAQLFESLERERATATFFAQVSEKLSSSLNLETTLGAAVQLAVPGFADWCFVSVLDEGGWIRLLSGAHRDAEQTARMRRIAAQYRRHIRDSKLLSEVIRSREPALLESVDDDLLQRTARDAEHLEALRRFEFRSGVAVPLIARNQTIGALTLAMADSGRHFSRDDVPFAQELARHIATAIDNARLYTEVVTSRERLSLAQHAARCWSWEIDLESGMVTRSPNFLELFPAAANLQAGTLDGMIAGIHPEDRAAARETIAQSAANIGKEHEVECRVMFPDGNIGWIYSRGRCLEREGKKRLVGIAMDVSHRKQVEAEAAAARELLHVAQSFASLATWRRDLKSRRIEWAEGGAQLYGVPNEHLATIEAWIERVDPADREIIRKAHDDAVASRSDYNAEFRTTLASGHTRWLWSRGRFEYDEQGEPAAIIGVTLDITDRKAAAEALQRSEKLAAAGRVAATVAHEINNPLEAVTNIVYLLQNSNGVSDEARAFLQQAQDELARVAHLTKQTLGFYRDTNRPSTFRISEVFHEVLDAYAPKIREKGIGVERNIAAAEPKVFSYRGEVRQVLSNLVANAIDAAHGKSLIRFSLASAGDRVRFTVGDNGGGIPPENLARIFEPFFTTKKDVGTGLGLWVTKDLVEKRGGSIRVQSGGGWTEFELEYPLQAGA